MTTHPAPVPADASATPVHAPARPHAALLAELADERVRRGLTLADLARRAGLPASTVRSALAPDANPTLATLDALARALERPLAAPVAAAAAPPAPLAAARRRRRFAVLRRRRAAA